MSCSGVKLLASTGSFSGSVYVLSAVASTSVNSVPPMSSTSTLPSVGVGVGRGSVVKSSSPMVSSTVEVPIRSGSASKEPSSSNALGVLPAR